MRYHGGKWRIAPWVISLLPQHRLYVEAFGGAASVLIRKPRSVIEVYNDLDGEMVNLFRVLRDPGSAERLRRLVYLTPWSRVEFIESYEPAQDPVEWARRTLVRGAMAHGSSSVRKRRSGFRARCDRQGGSACQAWANWPNQVEALVERLRGVVIEHRQASDLIEQQDGRQTLFYLDPPYPFEARTSIRWPSEIGRAYRHELTDGDHRALAEQLHQIKGMAVISGYDCPLYDELYGDWVARRRKTRADHARKRTEVLWFNEAAETAALHLFSEALARSSQS